MHIIASFQTGKYGGIKKTVVIKMQKKFSKTAAGKCMLVVSQQCTKVSRLILSTEQL